MRDRLPKYSKETTIKRVRSVCQYYVGKSYCVIKYCICDENYADRIAFHSVLRELIGSTKKELSEAGIIYETDFVDNVNENLHKGMKVIVSGEIVTGSYAERDAGR